MSSVDHKHDQLEHYLQSLSFNDIEKIPILPFINSKKSGNFVEYGVGSGPIQSLLTNIKNGSKIKIFACDIDKDVVETTKNHPIIKEYLKQKGNKPVIELIQVKNDVEMPFESGSISGINASSVLHEIYSYSGGFVGVDKFIREVDRILEVKGKLFYRDLGYIYDSGKYGQFTIKNDLLKFFINFFLPKFILHPSNDSLKKTHDPQKILISFTDKDNKLNSCNIEEFLFFNTEEVDFSRAMILHCNLIIRKEIERHFLIFLSEYNPFYLVYNLLKLEQTNIHQKILFKLRTKLQKYGINFDDIRKDDIQNYHVFEIFSKQLNKELNKTIKIDLIDKDSFHKYQSILGKKYLESNILDIKIGYFLSSELGTGFTVNKSSNIYDLLERGKLEGEEHYYYSSIDEIVSRVMFLTHNAEDGTILMPISYSHIYRDYYNYFISHNIENNIGYKPGDIKALIEFEKCSLSDIGKKCIDLPDNLKLKVNETLNLLIS